MIITIPGKPIAKKRPRFVRRGNYVMTYNPQETEEGRWLLSARSQIQGKMQGPLKIIIRFGMPIPKGLSNKKYSDIVGDYHTKKPDLDNCIKFVLDCLNGEAWEDDATICVIESSKFYHPEPFTHLEIMEAN